jgi:hypothetical protein
MDDQIDTSQTPEQDTSARQPPAVSRRAMLAGASKAAVPAIITLYSGAALARSSNLIGVNKYQGAEQDKYRCLDTSSVYRTDKPDVYDLGRDPMAHVTRIDTRREYYAADRQGNRTGKQVNGRTMCSDGGSYYRKAGYNGYQKVNVRKGVLVSATALSSFANDITYTDV